MVTRLRGNYEKACVDYLRTFLYMNELDIENGFWIGDEVGSTFDYGDGMFDIGMDDIIFCVENNITYLTYMAYIEYCLKCTEYNFTAPNFRSYFKGCPRVSKEVFDKLDAQKAELDRLIKEEKDRIDNGF